MPLRETISSDESGLLVAVQTNPKAVPNDVGTIWRIKEPNSYGSFGIQTNLVARSPINASRQNLKGTIVGFDATAEYEEDITPTNLAEDLQGFLFAEARYKDRLTATAITADGFTVVSGGGNYEAGDLVYAEGAALMANNGLRVVGAGSDADTVAVSGLTAATGQAITLYRVGRQFAADDLTIDASGPLPRLASASVDMTTLGLSVGEFVFLGGDGAAERFAGATNRGWCRIAAIDTESLTFDKTDYTMTTDAGAGKTVRLFFGFVVKNEQADFIKTYNYCLRRRLGRKDSASNVVQSEVVIGAVCNEMTITVPEEDKLTVNYTYMARDWEPVADDNTIAGVTVEPVGDDAYNSTGDAVRARMAVYPALSNNAAPTPLFAVLSELEFTINNNVSSNKGVTRMGSFSMTPGKFEVTGSFTAYFNDIEAVNTVKQNKDVTFDIAEYRNNKGFVIDFPLCALSTEGVELEANEPMMISIDSNMATGKKYNANMDHTMLVCFFPYLPTLAGDTVE